jgi:mandelamide amidase
VSDCDLLDSIATGNYSSPQRLSASLRGTRLAVARHYYLDGADAEVEKVFNDTISKLKDAGASVLEVDLGTDFGSMVEEANWALFFHDTQPDVTAFLRDQKIPLTFEEIYDGLEPHIKTRWQRFVLTTGAGYTEDVAYKDALFRRRPEVRRRFDSQVFSRADAIVFPTTLCAAPTIAEQWQYTVAGRTVNDVFLSRNTYPASFAGLPGISIPMGLTENGLPLGFELDASSGSDKALLTLARRVEQVIGFVRPPSVSA